MPKRNGKDIKCEECGKEFYVPKCYLDRRFCSMGCTQKASKLSRLGENNPAYKGKDGLYAYTNLHKQIRKRFGKADKCDNDNCSHKSSNYGWANITGIYELDISHFVKLCRSCHNNFDIYKRPISINKEIIYKKEVGIEFNDYKLTH